MARGLRRRRFLRRRGLLLGLRFAPAQAEPLAPAARRFLRLAERIRRRVEQQPVAIGGGAAVAVTISLGGAFAPQWVRSTATLWLERADQQLFRAKAEGRNRACIEEPAQSQVSAEEKSLLFSISQIEEPE